MRASLWFGVLLVCVSILVAPGRAQADLMSGLLGYWSMNSGVADSSDNGYNGTLQNPGGTSTFGAAAMVNGGWATTSNGAGWPNMVSPYIQLPSGNSNALRLADTSFTLTGWFEWNDVGASGNAHMFNGNVGGNNGYSLGMQAGQGGQTQQMSFNVGNASAIINSGLPNGGAWQNGVWYFFAARYDKVVSADNVYLWLTTPAIGWSNRSGAVTTQNVAPGDPGVDPTLGRTNAPGTFIGVRDEFAMWNRADQR